MLFEARRYEPFKVAADVDVLRFLCLLLSKKVHRYLLAKEEPTS